jgi:hypothetical protein
VSPESETRPVAPIAEDLRGASDDLLATLDELAALEGQKRQLRPGDPMTTELSERISQLAERVLSGTVVELRLSEQALTQATAGSADGPTAPIEETPRPLATILDEWREAERRAAGARPASAEWLVATADSERLREEYRRGLDAREREGREP